EVETRAAGERAADATEQLSESRHRQHDVAVDTTVQSGARPAALVIETSAGTVGTALATIQRLARRSALQAPVVLFSSFRLRSSDRARAFRYGADEVLGSEMGAAELLQRLAAAARRGHMTPLSSASHR